MYLRLWGGRARARRVCGEEVVAAVYPHVPGVHEEHEVLNRQLCLERHRLEHVFDAARDLAPALFQQLQAQREVHALGLVDNILLPSSPSSCAGSEKSGAELASSTPRLRCTNCRASSLTRCTTSYAAQ